MGNKLVTFDTAKMTALLILGALAVSGCGTQYEVAPLSEAEKAFATLGEVDAGMRSTMQQGGQGRFVDVIWGRKTGAKCVRWDIVFAADNGEGKLTLIKGLGLEGSKTHSLYQGSQASPNDVTAQTITFGAFDGARVFVPNGKKLTVRSLKAYDCTAENFNKEISMFALPPPYTPGDKDAVVSVSISAAYALDLQYKTR